MVNRPQAGSYRRLLAGDVDCNAGGLLLFARRQVLHVPPEADNADSQHQQGQ